MSRGVEWALHICTLLATLPDDATVPAAKLAEFYGLPPAYLAKQLQALAAAGVVTSGSGPNGGYRLGRSAAALSVLDVVEAVDGTIAAFVCNEIRRRGPSGQPDSAYSGPCTIAAVMARAENAWRSELAACSIVDLVSTLPDAVPARQQQEARAWLRANSRKGETIRQRDAGCGA